MTHDQGSSDFYPSADQLMPPTDEARVAFEEAFARLVRFADVNHSQGLDVTFKNPEEGVSMRVLCTYDEMTPAPGRGEGAARSNVVVKATLGEEDMVVGPRADLSEVGQVIAGLTQEEDDDTAKNWLNDVCAAAVSATARTDHTIGKELLEKSLVPILEHTSHVMATDFEDGSHVVGNWLTGNEEYLKHFPSDQPLRSLELKTPDGVSYDYTYLADGTERLFVKRAGEYIEPETDPTEPVNYDRGNGLNLSISGTPELIEALQVAIAERREASELGADKITMQSLSEFTEALNASIRSGVKRGEG